jgi:hypothetical protein
MSLPALPTGADARALSERVNVLIRDYNLGTPIALAIEGGAVVVDLLLSDVFELTVDADIANLTVKNARAGQGFLLELSGNGSTYEQSWPWTWLNPETPVLSDGLGKRDLAVVFTLNGVDFLAAMVAQTY